ncbi:restriction endonuclease subunit S [Pseudomonas sp. EA_35y_Pfl2_R111]|uniref:restriction endonuclease subunit S n=1 Tax=Pseudomonas sp. EA_35y_Pfl2_R111 TaxID=3088689 RepID=UPI0030D75AE4
MVPEGWTVNYLSDLSLKISDGIHTTPKYVDQSDIYFINGNNLKSGTIEIGNTTKNVSLDELEKHRKDLSDRTILMSINGTIGNLAYYKGEKVVLGKSAAYININNETNKNFIYHALSSEEIQNYFISELTGSTIRNLSLKSIKSTRIKTPPLPEQTKIAQILSTWDKAIATTERLLANSQQQKQALLGPLLSGQKRFAGYPEWVSTPIAKLLTESRLPGSNGEVAKKITVKLYGNGVFAKDEKRIGSESTKYFTRKAGQFIYSKLDFLNGAFGIIPEHLDGYESTLDLPAFDFTEYVEPAWLVQYISREEFYSAQLGLANGGRKARRVNPADLLRIEIPLPSLPEQQKIAQVLSTADAEISNLQAQLAKLKLEKKALMQQLLTGQRRVRLDDELEEEPQIRRAG